MANNQWLALGKISDFSDDSNNSSLTLDVVTKKKKNWGENSSISNRDEAQ